MKKLSAIAVSIFILIIIQDNIQANCTPDQSINEPGLSPPDTLFPCIIRNENYDEVLFFKNYDSVEIFNNPVKIEWLKILEIKNLPEGIQWISNKQDTTFYNQENGCIRFYGKSNAQKGHYELDIIVKVKIEGINLAIELSAKDRGLIYILTVIDVGDSCIRPQTTALDKTEILENKFIHAFVYPNPAKHYLNFNIYSFNSQSAYIHLFDLYGRHIYTIQADLVKGKNIINVEKLKFQKGQYFYMIDLINNGNVWGKFLIE